MNSIIRINSILLAVVFMMSATFMFSPTIASAQNRSASSASSACESLSVIDGDSGCDQKTDDVNVNNTLENILNLLSFVAGIIAVLMIMLAGLRYITSQGDSQKVSQAKNAIIYAAIGIVVVALAQLIVRFVLGFFA